MKKLMNLVETLAAGVVAASVILVGLVFVACVMVRWHWRQHHLI